MSRHLRTYGSCWRPPWANLPDFESTVLSLPSFAMVHDSPEGPTPSRQGNKEGEKGSFTHWPLNSWSSYLRFSWLQERNHCRLNAQAGQGEVCSGMQVSEDPQLGRSSAVVPPGPRSLPLPLWGLPSLLAQRHLRLCFDCGVYSCGAAALRVSRGPRADFRAQSSLVWGWVTCHEHAC